VRLPDASGMDFSAAWRVGFDTWPAAASSVDERPNPGRIAFPRPSSAAEHSFRPK